MRTPSEKTENCKLSKEGIVRRPIIIANWKMNTSLAEASILASSIKHDLVLENSEVVICPPSIWLVPVAEILHGAKNISVGAQNAFWENPPSGKGVYTGEISPKMLKNIAKFVIIGHSERRKYLLEDLEMINKKIKAVLDAGLTPVICIGEEKKRRLEKRTYIKPTSINIAAPMFREIACIFRGIKNEEMKKIIIAYEPVWAIGTGDAATGAYASAVSIGIREKIAKLYNQKIAQEMRILYGGSVDSKNIAEFHRQPEINGVLVGGASLKLREFLAICRETVK